MKVYQIKTQGETDTIACDGEVLDVLKFYISETDCLLEDIEEVVEFPKENWKGMTLFFEEMEPVTLEEYMKGHTWNEIIASTDY